MARMGKGSLLFWGFRTPRELLRGRLGTLEQQVIDIVWTSGEVTVRDVHTRLDGKVAYTTAMTTLDRLYRKGLLQRTKRTRAFVYSAAASREELERLVATDVVSGLLSGELSAPLPFLSNLVDAVGAHDRALLDELDRLIKTKRRQLDRRGSKLPAARPPARGQEDV
jgi:predicted transcriptional regulator